MKRTGRYFQEFNYIQILLIPLHNSNRELDVIISTRDSSSSTNFRFEIQRQKHSNKTQTFNAYFHFYTARIFPVRPLEIDLVTTPRWRFKIRHVAT